VIACIQQGWLRENELIELGDIINGTRPGRIGGDQMTFFKSVGVAVQDVAAAQQALTTARQKKLGTAIELDKQ